MTYSPLAAAIGDIIRQHQPTTGMRVASGETCRCGYWTGTERPGKDRPVGHGGLTWHQAQEITAAIDRGDIPLVVDTSRLDPSADDYLTATLRAFGITRPEDDQR